MLNALTNFMQEAMDMPHIRQCVVDGQVHLRLIAERQLLTVDSRRVVASDGGFNLRLTRCNNTSIEVHLGGKPQRVL
jgi:hypothetical protein